MGLQGYEAHETSTLSGGQKQRVAIAGVLAMKPQILVLDEASAMLDPRGRKGLLRVCRELHERGMTIVMITHFMEEAALAERVVVMGDGGIRLDGAPEEVLVQGELLESLNLDVPAACRLSLTAAARRARAHLRNRKRAERGAMSIVFDQVSFTYDNPERAEKQRRRKKRRREKAKAQSGATAKPSEKPAWGTSPDAVWALRDISFTLEDGEFFGVAGHTGSGKSTLLQHINGLVRPTCGTVSVGGRDLRTEGGSSRARTGGHGLPVS